MDSYKLKVTGKITLGEIIPQCDKKSMPGIVIAHKIQLIIEIQVVFVTFKKRYPASVLPSH
jgi:hypothetical protein